MAEYQMTINELEEYVDSCIKEYQKSGLNAVDWELNKPALMAALTMMNIHGESEQETASNVATLWNNKIQKNSEFLFGKKYVRIKDVMISVIKSLLITGFLDGILLSAISGNIAIPTVAALSNAAFEIYTVLNDAAELDDVSLCIYLEVTSHNKLNKKFTIEELKSWFTNGALSCFHKKGKWVCLHDNSGACSVQEKDIDNAVKSLFEKKFISLERKDNIEYYKFKK